MKTSPFILFTLLFLTVTGLSAQRGPGSAEDRPDPAERAAQQTERLTKLLELTPEQAAQVLEINQTFATEMGQLRSEARDTRNAAQVAHRQAMEAILNDEQQAKLEALLARREERRADRRRKGRE